jgi:outer membrane protein insertion porin family
MNYQMFHRQVAVVAILLALNTMPLSALAQSVDVPDNSFEDENVPFEPTPIEELAPSSEGEVVPGTEPLYDKGITVTEIEITGNDKVPADVVLKAIGTQPGSLYSKRKLQADLKKIYDTGYFTEHLRVVPIATRDGVHLRIEVEENPIVNSFEFTGPEEVKEEELQKIFADQIGMPQNVNAINKGIQAVEQLYKDKGYILARVDDIQEDKPGTVKLTVSEGRISKITYSGNKKTKDYVLRRAMVQKEGDTYNEKTVSEDLKRIFASQTFSDVRRDIKASAEKPGEYDLVIEVDEKKTGAISLGGGVDTGTGVFGSVGYNDPNFLGRGQNISTMFSAGTGVLGSTRGVVKRRVLQAEANWFDPSFMETSNSLGTSLYGRDLASFNVPLAIERRYGGEVTWGRPLETVPGASVSLGLGYEDINVREGTSSQNLRDFGVNAAERRNQLEDGSFAYLSPGFTFDSRNNRYNPNSGWLSAFNSRLAAGLSEADSYGTLTANIRRYLKVTDNVTFALNTQAGGKAFGNVPDFNMFRLGGSYTIRGFQEGGVGIGQGYVLGSAELRSKVPFLKNFTKFPIYDMLQMVLFMDAGTLFEEATTNDLFGRPGYAASIGAGIRMNIPQLGPIRVDFATPLTSNLGGYTRRYNFGVGQKF